MEILTLREAATFLKYSEKRLRALCHAGRIPCQQVGGRCGEFRFSKQALEAWISGGHTNVGNSIRCLTRRDHA